MLCSAPHAGAAHSPQGSDLHGQYSSHRRLCASVNPVSGPAYDSSKHPPFAVTADLVVLTIRAERFCVLLVQRGGQPFEGEWALPGGFTRLEEDIAAAAYRELAEECGVGRDDVVLEQLRTYGAPGRDPRMRVVSVAWLALVPTCPSRGPVATRRARGGRRWTRRWSRGWRSTTPRSCATGWSGPGQAGVLRAGHRLLRAGVHGR